MVQGRVRAGDKVLVMPLEDPATAVRLERNGAPVRGARAGDNAEVVLSGVDPSRVVVGNVVCKAGGALPAVRRFNAQIVALPALEASARQGRKAFAIELSKCCECVRLPGLFSSSITGCSTKDNAKPKLVPKTWWSAPVLFSNIGYNY